MITDKLKVNVINMFDWEHRCMQLLNALDNVLWVKCKP